MPVYVRWLQVSVLSPHSTWISQEDQPIISQFFFHHRVNNFFHTKNTTCRLPISSIPQYSNSRECRNIYIKYNSYKHKLYHLRVRIAMLDSFIVNLKTNIYCQCITWDVGRRKMPIRSHQYTSTLWAAEVVLALAFTVSGSIAAFERVEFVGKTGQPALLFCWESDQSLKID